MRRVRSQVLVSLLTTMVACSSDDITGMFRTAVGDYRLVTYSGLPLPSLMRNDSLCVLGGGGCVPFALMILEGSLTLRQDSTAAMRWLLEARFPTESDQAEDTFRLVWSLRNTREIGINEPALLAHFERTRGPFYFVDNVVGLIRTELSDGEVRLVRRDPDTGDVVVFRFRRT
jgi:hypothetical protein